ncbi:thiol peroxidase [Lederbergia citrea]|uniref:Thiol peroxidase n=1 Tax=Lederbergia citrea TaxID=2833581 RepID=A0A942Z4T3_9BACI|nr:thiol peroxidase [Lederbergia citrea]MBS4176037.1 thiol peroxidase [Lederbergia citrea]MBS4202599.1 thiol peroxidase [Lederbergia citrea]MBS4222735.1 thiol peroxidase [Lederbergia citrea]
MAQVTFKGNPITLVGSEVKVGDKAPDFTVLANDLSEVKLSDFAGTVRIISVVPSVDTGVCAAQTKRFNEEVANLENVQVLTISADLPFAQARWAQENGLNNAKIFSDHRDLSFGEAFGTVIQELRLLARSVFVIDSNDQVVYAEYVSEGTNHPEYDSALVAAKQAK